MRYSEGERRGGANIKGDRPLSGSCAVPPKLLKHSTRVCFCSGTCRAELGRLGTDSARVRPEVDDLSRNRANIAEHGRVWPQIGQADSWKSPQRPSLGLGAVAPAKSELVRGSRRASSEFQPQLMPWRARSRRRTICPSVVMLPLELHKLGFAISTRILHAVRPLSGNVGGDWRPRFFDIGQC